MKTVLNPGEMEIAQTIATLRRCVNQTAGVKDKRMDASMEVIDLDLIGAVSEVAWAKVMNVYPDLSIQPRHGSADSLMGGKKIDIKATRRKNGRLLAVKGKAQDAADLYVLAIVDGASVDFIGYALTAEFIHEKNIDDIGRGPCYVMDQSRLRRFKADIDSEVEQAA